MRKQCHSNKIRETIVDREDDWKTIWKQIKFGEKEDAPKEKPFLKWLSNIPLYGNFRDLQKIALYYHNFTKFEQELVDLLPAKTPFQYAQSEFEKLQSRALQSKKELSYFDENKNIKTMQQNFNKDLANWAIQYFGSAQKAVDYFNEQGDKTTVETLYRWRNLK